MLVNQILMTNSIEMTGELVAISELIKPNYTRLEVIRIYNFQVL